MKVLSDIASECVLVYKCRCHIRPGTLPDSKTFEGLLSRGLSSFYKYLCTNCQIFMYKEWRSEGSWRPGARVENGAPLWRLPKAARARWGGGRGGLPGKSSLRRVDFVQSEPYFQPFQTSKPFRISVEILRFFTLFLLFRLTPLFFRKKNLCQKCSKNAVQSWEKKDWCP